MNDSEPKYEVFWKGVNRGPFTLDELRLLVRSGEVGRLAKTKSTSGSTTVGDLLLNATTTSPPPLPPENLLPQKQVQSPQIFNPSPPLPVAKAIVPLFLTGCLLALVSGFFLPVFCAIGAIAAGTTLLTKRALWPGITVLALAALVPALAFVVAIPESSPTVAAGSSKPMELPALRASTKPAVVQVVSLDPSDEILATGSGFYVERDIVVTNFHVVSEAARVVFLLDDETRAACIGVLALDESRDLALLRSERAAPGFLALEKGAIEEGERIAVVGSPMGFEGTLSDGIVSAVRKDPSGIEFVQMSAAISPGSSGSPVVNRFGRVVGVATMYHTGGQSLNFAVSSRELAQLLSQSPNNSPPENP